MRDTADSLRPFSCQYTTLGNSAAPKTQAIVTTASPAGTSTAADRSRMATSAAASTSVPHVKNRVIVSLIAMTTHKPPMSATRHHWTFDRTVAHDLIATDGSFSSVERNDSTQTRTSAATGAL